MNDGTTPHIEARQEKVTIYVDVLILTNVYITYFFIKSVMLVSHRKYTVFKVISASLIGGISSLQIFISDSLFFSFAVKLITLFIISLILSGLRLKTLFDTAGKLILVNLLFIGMCVLIWKILGRAVYIIGVTVYFDISLIILVLVTAITYAVFWIYDYISFRNCAKKGASVEIKTESVSVRLDGISDTGNSLYDFFSQKSVIVCSSDELEAAFKNKLYKLLPYSTVNGSGLIKVYTPKCVYIDNRQVDVSIAITKLDETKAIFNPNILR